MRCVTRRTAFSLQRCVFISEWSLLVRMTLNAGGIRTSGQSRLLQLETTMWVVAVATLHHPFEHLVVEWLIEVGLNFSMATDA